MVNDYEFSFAYKSVANEKQALFPNTKDFWIRRTQFFVVLKCVYVYGMQVTKFHNGTSVDENA